MNPFGLLILLLLQSAVIFFCNGRIHPPKVLVIGGSGRVGGSAVRSIASRIGSSNVASAGRSTTNWEDYTRQYHICSDITFHALDINDKERLIEIVSQYDIIVNTAGPFQGLQDLVVLKAALSSGKKYIDVCDDINLSRKARSAAYQNLAKQYNSTAVISAGIWPGCSSLLAQELIRRVGGPDQVEKLTFSFFTAGSGGAGPTILTATFLILGENVLTYRNGKAVYYKSATDKRIADFGESVGFREVVRLNLIECESCYCSGVQSVETFFGTAPRFWNTLFVLMANIIPQNILQNRSAMKYFGYLSLPIVRLIDKLVGSANGKISPALLIDYNDANMLNIGIRVDIIAKDGKSHNALLVHKDMEAAVGDSLAAFVTQLASNSNLKPGVFFPEEVSNDHFREAILADISVSSINYNYSIS